MTHHGKSGSLISGHLHERRQSSCPEIKTGHEVWMASAPPGVAELFRWSCCSATSARMWMGTACWTTTISGRSRTIVRICCVWRGRASRACYVLGKFGIELQFDWRDYLPADVVCQMEPDGQPPPGYLINAGRQVRFHLNRALPTLDALNPKPGKRRRDRIVQEYLRRSLDVSVHLIEGTADILRIASTRPSTRPGSFLPSRCRPTEATDRFPRRSYVQLVPPTKVP
jgi:hypothetical protein